MATFESKKQIVEENISKLDKIISNTLEKRVAHVIDKADMLSEIGADGEKNAFRSMFGDEDLELPCIEENKKYVSSVCEKIKDCDKLFYVDVLADKDISAVVTETKESFDVNTVVYLKNPLTDIAYNSFCKVITDARVLYKESFADVCEEVYYSRAPYCILPLENYEDGRLTGFVNMIRKYELKIVLTCNVENANGKITKFALLKRELTVLDCPKSLKEEEYLEIGFNFGQDIGLHEVLGAAKYFGYKLNKVDSLPIYYSEKEYYFDVVFSGNGDIKRLIHWLELEMPRYEILGIYTHISTM